MPTYKHIFFDLDRTIWDFEANAKEAFRDIYVKYDNLGSIFPGLKTFHSTFRKHNRSLWEDYRNDKIDKETLKYVRFLLTLKEFGKDDEQLAKKLAEEYVNLSATKTQLFPHAHEVLHHLKRHYNLYIITNGFHDIQLKKIKNSELNKYFRLIITSEMAGVQKPHEQIFYYALEQARVKIEDAIMVGDDIEGDIKGARNIGLDQVFFNPHGIKHGLEPTYEIQSLNELINIFG